MVKSFNTPLHYNGPVDTPMQCHTAQSSGQGKSFNKPPHYKGHKALGSAILQLGPMCDSLGTMSVTAQAQCV